MEAREIKLGKVKKIGKPIRVKNSEGKYVNVYNLEYKGYKANWSGLFFNIVDPKGICISMVDGLDHKGVICVVEQHLLIREFELANKQTVS
jgi:hypothetical protein